MKKFALVALAALWGVPAFAQLQQTGGYGPSPITTSAITQVTGTNTTALANTNFTNLEIARSHATTSLAVTGGTYNFATNGTGLAPVVQASSGAITGILALASGGTGYVNGDVVVLQGGNNDAIIQVTNASGGVVQSGGLTILYGGTGYSTSLTTAATVAIVAAGNTITLTGTLTSNATIIFEPGMYLTNSTQLIINNNTTGAFNTTLCMSNGSGACNAGATVVVPQGTGNSCATGIQTDGVNAIWLEAIPVCGSSSVNVTLGGINVIGGGSYPNWSTTSPVFNVPAMTLTDNSGSGTIALRGAYTIGNCTFAASSAETITSGSCLYIGNPVAGTNTTLTGGGNSIQTNGNINIGGTGSFSGMVSGQYIRPTGSTVASVGIYLPSANALGFGTNTTAAGVIDNTQHWRVGGAGTPTIAANACGSTTQGVVTAGGNDQAFLVTAGTAGVTNCVVNFASAFTTAPREVQLTPANATAAATGTTLAYVSALSTTSVTITGTALAGAAYYVQVQ